MTSSPIRAPTESAERKVTYGFADLALAFLSVVVVYAKSYETTIKAIDSSIYAGLSLAVTGQGFIPHLPMGLEAFGGGYGTRGFNDHPGVLLYVAGWVMRLFGPAAWSARLVPCLMAAGCMPALYAFARRLAPTERFRAWLAAGILALTVPFVRNAAGFQLDAPMVFLILLSFLAWEKGAWLRAGFWAGLSIVVKAPIGLLLFPVVLIAQWIVTTGSLSALLKPSRFWRDWFGALAVCLGIVAAYWAMVAQIGGGALVTDYWGRYVGGTLQGRDGSQPFDPFLFFREIGRLYWPWLLFVILGLFSFFRAREWKKRSELIPVLAAAIVIVLVSMIRFKSGAHYFLPVYPFLAWIAAKPVAAWLKTRELGFLRGAAMTVFAGGLAVIAFPIHFAPEAFPALRKFNALIQSSGTIADRVLYVNGDFPYGSFMDYIPEIHFYTGRQTIVKDCEAVNTAVATEPAIRWVIVAGVNYARCFDPQTRAFFPTVYRVGKVYLLSREMRSAEIDLTPLDRELKAALDGAAANLTRNIYQ